MDKPYKIGDIVAVLVPEKNKAFSCKVLNNGVGETLKGKTINFNDDQVLWVRGPNMHGEIFWPKHVLEAFNGRYVPLEEMT